MSKRLMPKDMWIFIMHRLNCPYVLSFVPEAEPIVIEYTWDKCQAQDKLALECTKCKALSGFEYHKKHDNGHFNIALNALTHYHRLHWIQVIFQHFQISENFMMFFHKKSVFPWKTVAQYQKLTPGFISAQHTMLDWELVCRYQKIPSRLVHQYEDLMRWEVFLSANPFLTVEKVEQYIKEFNIYMNWNDLIHYKRVSLEFLKERLHTIDWVCASAFYTFPQSLINELTQLGKVTPTEMIKCQNVTNKYIANHRLILMQHGAAGYALLDNALKK